MTERTFSIVKPDAMKARQAGEILSRLEKAGFDVVALRLRRLTRAEAEGFYHVHRARPFFASLSEFMSSGPCLTMVLEGENAIARLREIMGATDPAKAAPGTIRGDLASSIEANCIHGSDAPETARFEIGFFFPGIELIPRAPLTPSAARSAGRRGRRGGPAGTRPARPSRGAGRS